MGNGVASQYGVSINGGMLAAFTWTKIKVTFVGTTATLFVNGDSKSSQSFSGGARQLLTYDIAVGQFYCDNNAQLWTGKIRSMVLSSPLRVTANTINLAPAGITCAAQDSGCTTTECCTVVPKTCADTAGAQGGVFDCANHTNYIDAAPAGITCAAQDSGCTAILHWPILN